MQGGAPSAQNDPYPTSPYNYDANGRVTAHLKANLTVQQFSYDPEGHLTQVVGSSGTEQLSYDPTGALAVRNQSGNKTIYVGASMTLTVSAGVATGKLHVLLGGGRVATIPVSGAALYYHRDRLGSIVATSTAGGAAGAYYRYSPYGALDKTSGEAGSTISELGYTGVLRLSEGLVYLNARVYNPQMRRFLQPDSVDSRRYTYASGDPINYTDPTGLRSNEWRAERDPGYGNGFSFATSATGSAFQPYSLATESCANFGCSGGSSQSSTLDGFIQGWQGIETTSLPDTISRLPGNGHWETVKIYGNADVEAATREEVAAYCATNPCLPDVSINLQPVSLKVWIAGMAAVGVIAILPEILGAGVVAAPGIGATTATFDWQKSESHFPKRTRACQPIDNGVPNEICTTLPKYRVESC